MVNFGWDLPPGCSQRDIDDTFGGGEDCEHELCQYCERCHVARCGVFEEPCANWMLDLVETQEAVKQAYLVWKEQLPGMPDSAFPISPIILQYREIVVWRKELEAQIKAENAAMVEERELCNEQLF